MRTFAIPILLAVLLAASCKSRPELETLAQAEARTQALQQSLQTELLAAIAAGGPASAIAVCQTRAPELASEQGGDGWSVGRTALRVRNPANAPTDWQRVVLEKFSTRAAAGDELASLTWHEVVEQGGRQTLRYMRAIPTGGVCLGCHGSEADIEPATKKILAEVYPADRAIGFAVGELRGAFVVTVEIE